MAAWVRPENLIPPSSLPGVGKPGDKETSTAPTDGSGGDIRGDAEEVGDELVVFYPTQPVWNSYLVY